MQSKTYRWLLSLVGLALVGISTPTHANEAIILAWHANPEAYIAGYSLHYGVEPGHYTNRVNIGKGTNAIVGGLVRGQTYYFAVSAIAADGKTSAESPLSEEISYTIPIDGTDVVPELPGAQARIQGNNIGVMLSGNPGVVFDIERSSDLKRWIPVGRYQLPSETWFQHFPRTAQREFFRVVRFSEKRRAPPPAPRDQSYAASYVRDPLERAPKQAAAEDTP